MDVSTAQGWTDFVAQYALLLFTRSQWHALIIFLVSITLLTEQIKRIFFLNLPAKRKRRAIYATSAGLAIVGSLVGYFVNVGNIETWFWVFTGSSGGMVSNLSQKLVIALVAWKFPELSRRMEGKPEVSYEAAS